MIFLDGSEENAVIDDSTSLTASDLSALFVWDSGLGPAEFLLVISVLLTASLLSPDIITWISLHCKEYVCLIYLSLFKRKVVLCGPQPKCLTSHY